MLLQTITKEHAKTWTTFWNGHVVSVVNSLGAGNSGIASHIFTAGRLAAADFFTTDSTAPTVPPSPSGVVAIPNGWWLVEGNLVEVNEDGGFLFLAVELNQPDGLYYYLTATQVDLGEDEGTGYVLAIDATRTGAVYDPAHAAAGFPSLGLVKTDFETVTSVNAKPPHADVLPPYVSLVAFVLGLMAGGDNDAVTHAQLDAALAPILAAIAALQLALAALQNSIDTGVTGVQNDSPIMTINLARLIGAAVDQNPQTARRFLAAIDMPHATGDAQQWGEEVAPDVVVGGTAIVDYVQGEIR
jgi:hypothetical protein